MLDWIIQLNYLQLSLLKNKPNGQKWPSTCTILHHSWKVPPNCFAAEGTCHCFANGLRPHPNQQFPGHSPISLTISYLLTAAVISQFSLHKAAEGSSLVHAIWSNALNALITHDWRPQTLSGLFLPSLLRPHVLSYLYLILCKPRISSLIPPSCGSVWTCKIPSGLTLITGCIPGQFTQKKIYSFTLELRKWKLYWNILKGNGVLVQSIRIFYTG